MNSKEFDKLWDTVISPEAQIICDSYGDLLFADFLKDDIFAELKSILEHSKTHYMRDAKRYVDRHKVSAAVMIALLKNPPIKIVGPKFYSKKTSNLVFNEQLAITTGLSILTSFCKKSIKDDIDKGEATVNDLKKFENGIKLPVAKHGKYRSNWATELYFMRKEGNYNILALAHELFFLEYTTAKS